MAGRRSRHECRPLGELLKGLPDPVEAVEVLWEPLGGADTGISIPLPGRCRGTRRRRRRARHRDSDDDRRHQAGGRGRGTRSAPRLGRGRSGQDHTRGGSGPGRLRRRSVRAVRSLRGGSRHPVPTLRRSARPLRDPCPRGSAAQPPSDPWVGAVETGSDTRQSDPGPPTLEGHRSRHRAVPPVCCGRGAAGDDLGAPDHRPRPRRPAMGRQGEPPPAPSPDRFGRTDAAADRRDLSGQ